MKKSRILFVCVNNSDRSQMAEAFFNQLAGEEAEAMSAGLEPGELNPLAVKVMKKVGIDIFQNKTKSAFELYQRGNYLLISSRFVMLKLRKDVLASQEY